MRVYALPISSFHLDRERWLIEREWYYFLLLKGAIGDFSKTFLALICHSFGAGVQTRFALLLIYRSYGAGKEKECENISFC
jgi:hypothetical protein